jgi:hypothetical protein
MISASDPGVQLHVRNKRLEGRDTFLAERVVLFVPGATYPSETFFDTNLPGGSCRLRLRAVFASSDGNEWMREVAPNSAS